MRQNTHLHFVFFVHIKYCVSLQPILEISNSPLTLYDRESLTGCSIISLLLPHETGSLLPKLININNIINSQV